jgi:PAS domain S-box-containing protein
MPSGKNFTSSVNVHLNESWFVVILFGVVFFASVTVKLFPILSSIRQSVSAAQLYETHDVARDTTSFIQQNEGFLNVVSTNYQDIIYHEGVLHSAFGRTMVPEQQSLYTMMIALNKTALQTFINDHNFSAVMLVGADGTPVNGMQFAESGFQTSFPDTYANDLGFKTAMLGKDFVSAPFIVSDNGKKIPAAAIYIPFTYMPPSMSDMGMAGSANMSSVSSMSQHYVIIGYLDLDFIEQYLSNKSTTHTYIIDQGGNVVLDPTFSNVVAKKNVAGLPVYSAVITNKKSVNGSDTIYDYTTNGTQMFVTAVPLPEFGWGVITESPYNQTFSSYTNVIQLSVITSIIGLVIFLLLIQNVRNLSKYIMLFENESNERSAIIQSMTDGILEYDQNSMILYINTELERMLGIPAADVMGKVINSDTLKSSPNWAPLVQVMFPYLANDVKDVTQDKNSYPKIMEASINMPDKVKLRIVTNPVLDRNQKTIGFVKIVEDITREEAISQMKSEFISVAAHQLRTPLSAVKWTLKMLLEGDLGSITAEQKDFITKGYDTNEHMIRLVSDLLDVSRIEEGKFGYTFVMTSLDKLVSDLVNQSQLKAQEKQIILKYVPPPAPVPDIKIDPEKLVMAIQNLIENAIRYTLKGGSVTVSLSTNATNEIIAVQDTGVGIPQEQINRLFTKFFRADNVIRMQTEGSGLGLYITRNIVRRHGGDITVTSREGQGSTFAIALPLDVSRVPEKEQPQEGFESFLKGI